MKFALFPEQASTSAGQVDAVYLVFVGISLVFLLLIFGPMSWFLFRYRRGREVNRELKHTTYNKLEVAWTLIPLLLMIGLFGWSAAIFYDLRHPPENAFRIHVVGKQWMWKAHHPEGVRELNELHLPVDRTTKLLMTSEDVIHSFYIPAFRVKQDVVPGHYSTLWFHPTQTGVYHLFCAEYCGTDHSQMKGRIVVLSQAEYQEWLEQAGTAENLAEQGAALYRQLGCSGCHESNQRVRAPSLSGLYGRPVPLQDGAVVNADEQYLRDSILLPNAQVPAGYQPVMPTFQGQITEEQVLKLVAYIKSLADPSEDRTR